MEINEEKRELVPSFGVKEGNSEYEDDDPLSLPFNYINIYMLVLTNIFFIHL